MSFSMETSLLPSSNCSSKMVIQQLPAASSPVSPNDSHPQPRRKSPRISVKKPATPITTEQNSATPATGVTVQRGRHVIFHTLVYPVYVTTPFRYNRPRNLIEEDGNGSILYTHPYKIQEWTKGLHHLRQRQYQLVQVSLFSYLNFQQTWQKADCMQNVGLKTCHYHSLPSKKTAMKRPSSPVQSLNLWTRTEWELLVNMERKPSPAASATQHQLLPQCPNLSE